jgi:hypothetical protein
MKAKKTAILKYTKAKSCHRIIYVIWKINLKENLEFNVEINVGVVCFNRYRLPNPLNSCIGGIVASRTKNVQFLPNILHDFSRANNNGYAVATCFPAVAKHTFFTFSRDGIFYFYQKCISNIIDGQVCLVRVQMDNFHLFLHTQADNQQTSVCMMSKR